MHGQRKWWENVQADETLLQRVIDSCELFLALSAALDPMLA